MRLLRLLPGVAVAALIVSFSWWSLNIFQIKKEDQKLLGDNGSKYTGTGAGIAIIDSGVDTDNGVLTDALLGPGWNTIDHNTDTSDESGHGTKVASLIAGNGKYGCSRGLARGAELFIYKSGNKEHFAENEREAILYAAQNDEVDIILITVGGGRRTALNPKVLSALMVAVTRDKAIVSVAGNGGGTSPVQPSALAGMLNAPGLLHTIVGASNKGKKAEYSHQFGKLAKYGIMAPGKAMVPSSSGFCLPTKGTSFSAPRVASILALLVEAFPDVSMRQRVDALLNGADKVFFENKNVYDNDMGRGIVSFDGAYEYLRNQ